MPLGPTGPPEIRAQEASQSEEKDGPKEVCVDLSKCGDSSSVPRIEAGLGLLICSHMARLLGHPDQL